MWIMWIWEVIQAMQNWDKTKYKWFGFLYFLTAETGCTYNVQYNAHTLQITKERAYFPYPHHKEKETLIRFDTTNSSGSYRSQI